MILLLKNGGHSPLYVSCYAPFQLTYSDALIVLIDFTLFPVRYSPFELQPHPQCKHPSLLPLYPAYPDVQVHALGCTPLPGSLPIGFTNFIPTPPLLSYYKTYLCKNVFALFKYFLIIF